MNVLAQYTYEGYFLCLGYQRCSVIWKHTLKVRLFFKDLSVNYKRKSYVMVVINVIRE